MDVVARLELRRAELQMLVDSLNERAAKLEARGAWGDVAVADNLLALRLRILGAAQAAGFVVSFGQVLPPRDTARNVHTGAVMSAEQRTVSALRARNVHARSVHSRRAAMYVHPGDHARRFGPEREPLSWRVTALPRTCPGCGAEPMEDQHGRPETWCGCATR